MIIDTRANLLHTQISIKVSRYFGVIKNVHFFLDSDV